MTQRGSRESSTAKALPIWLTFDVALRLRQLIYAILSSVAFKLAMVRQGKRLMFLTACLIMLVLSAVVSFRRSKFLSRNFQGRLAAVWPSLCAGIFALGLIGFDRIQDKQEFAPSATIHLMMLIGAFAFGWFAGVFVEHCVQEQASSRENSARIGGPD
jgi:hypothetical protein